MQFSPIGFLISAALLLLGYGMGAPLLVGLMGSLAFGATALVTLHSLGGASPLIYTFFVGLLLGTFVLRRHLWRDIGILFRHSHASWIVSVLLVYAVVGSVFFPRLFAGQTSVFVASRTQGGVFEVPLAPVSGNISQTGYLVIGGITFIALCAILLRRRNFDALRVGFFVWCILHTGMGLMDFCAKLSGLGDVLGPIRTASYAMLTSVDQAGFVRIVGAQPEASSFAALSLAALAFTFTYWRKTRSHLALALSAALIFLLALSTSSTAYIGLALLCLPVMFSMGCSLLGGRIDNQNALLLTAAMSCVLAILALAVIDPALFDPFIRLFNVAILDKANSSSGQERSYWNYISLKSFFDTVGLGVGLGSSRASSWLIAVLSQLGALGAIAFLLLILILLTGGRRAERERNLQDAATIASVRACALAGLVSNSLISGTADPGLLFFVSLAIVVTADLQRSGFARLQVPLAPSGAMVPPHPV